MILYTKKLEDLEENVRLHQSEVTMAGEASINFMLITKKWN